MGQIPFLPTEASTSAVQIDQVFLELLLLSVFFTVLVAGLILYSIVKYRRRSEREIGHGSTGNPRLEWGGMGVLTVLALGTFFWAGSVYTHVVDPPADAIPVFITGKQWMWKAQHQTGQREINTLHVPVGQDIKLVMTSEDVIHSFYVPAFRIKMDVLPDRYSTLWFKATQPGTYHLFCAEYCGTGHSLMRGDIIVMTAADYQAWLGGGPQQSPAQQGAKLFQDLSCDACHRSDSLARAPNLVGLYGQPVRLTNGRTITADANYIRESILNPSAKVVEGFQPIMPSFQGRIDEQELFDLIAFVQSLGQQPGAPAAGTTQPFLPSVGSPPTGLPPSAPVEGGTPSGAGIPAIPAGGTPTPNATPGQ